jgi:hypothetical protein
LQAAELLEFLDLLLDFQELQVVGAQALVAVAAQVAMVVMDI